MSVVPMNFTADGNSTSEQWLVQDRLTGQVTAAFLLLILVVGLPWNLLVVLTIVKEKLYHQPNIILLLNLLLTDLIKLVFIMPVLIATGFSGEFMLGATDSIRQRFCNCAVLSVFFALMSIYTITILSVDRFLYIYKPLQYQRVVTSLKVVVLLIILWLYLILLSSISLAEMDMIFTSPFLFCFPDLVEANATIIVLLVLTILPILVMLFFNVATGVIVQKNIRAIYDIRNARRLDSGNNSGFYKTVKKKRCRKQLNFIRLFGATLGCNLIAWLPAICLVLYMMITSSGPDDVSSELLAFSNVMFLSQVLFHSILVSLMLKEVKEPIKKKVCFCRKEVSVTSVKSEESGRSWSCERTRCGEFMSILHDAVLEYSRHSFSQQGEGKGSVQGKNQNGKIEIDSKSDIDSRGQVEAQNINSITTSTTM